MDENQLMQEKLMQFQMLQQQIKDVSTQAEEVAMRLSDVESIITSIKEVSKVKPGNEILVPISNGIFMKADTKETTEFLVNVGQGGVAKKNTEEVVQMLEKQKVELLNLQTETTNEAKGYQNELIVLQQELEKVSKDKNTNSEESDNEYEL